ncbi:MAG: amino acid permease [Deltaproteobacteria bacterium]|nr:amino acid permease [Deltaproteobacteria bacterium]
MAFIFARYALTLYAPFDTIFPIYAAAAVIVLTVINIIGVKEGKWTQNLLTVIKTAGLLAIIAIGLFASVEPPVPSVTPDITIGGLKLALILVLFAFGGWNEMAYVAAEVKKPNRNIVRTLVIGTVLVTVLYIKAIAVDTMATVFPEMAARAISILICISALGAINGLIFTGARISYAMGAEHPSFRGLGTWSPRFGTPIWALIVQGCLSLAIVLFVGSFIDTILYTAPVVWLFFLATGLSVFVLRHKDPQTPRPYKVSGFPVPAIVFCTCCVFMLYSSVSYALAVKPIGFITVTCVVLAGIVVYRLTEVRQKPKTLRR